MRHRKKTAKLSRTAAHRKAMFCNMSVSLLRHEAIVTTEAKGKALRGYVEPLITLARRGGVHNIRLAERSVKDREILAKLFDEIGPRYAERDGGYTRLHKLGRRKGDNAPLVRISLV
jgi:large subunit ribosomal protein L17